MASAKTKEPVIEFEVKGKGEFPLDMLRYDCCYPASEKDSAEMLASFTRRDAWRSTFTIRLKRVREYRPLGATDGRWASFGWTVIR